jgi:hypothetical protein
VRSSIGSTTGWRPRSSAPAERSRSYLQPFALRALGAVRGDKELVRQAHERFEALKLRWHAAQTRALLGK